VADEPVMDESFWEEKAEEARLVANILTTPPAKSEMLGIAAAYARLARYAKHQKEPPNPAGHGLAGVRS
jgi:hypothetical protein